MASSPLFFVFLLALSLLLVKGEDVSIVLSSPDHFKVVTSLDKSAAIYGTLADDRDTLGWSRLHLVMSPSLLSNPRRGFYMGFAEGFLTATHIQNHLLNVDYLFELFGANEHNEDKRSRILSAIDTNIAYIRNTIKSNNTDPLWAEVEQSMFQLEGILEGLKRKGVTNITFSELFFLNILGDAMDVLEFVGNFPALYPPIFMSRCSAFAKFIEGELTFSHNTWAFYPFLTRIYKYYDFPTKKGGNYRVEMSSYPAALSSIDDFHVVSVEDKKGVRNSVVVSETSLNLMNKTTASKISLEALLTNFRVAVALKMAGLEGAEAASNGDDIEIAVASMYVHTMSKHNSGTYNNANILVLPENKMIFIAEQIPGSPLYYSDFTHILYRDGYFGSYNIAYNSKVRDALGYNDMQKKQGDDWSFDNCPRAKIMRRDHKMITTLKEFIEFMKYNDYKNDEFGNNNPSNAMCARFDLSSRGIAGGGYDYKVFRAGKIYARVGPSQSSPSTPVFSFKDWPNVPHHGIPDEFHFPDIELSPIF
ncbi:hypothetical protein RCL1_002545 [Eukaryota sp. TZLM3-RCL]